LTIFAFGMKLKVCALPVPPPTPSKGGDRSEKFFAKRKISPFGGRVDWF